MPAAKGRVSAKATLAGPRLESRPATLRDVPLFPAWAPPPRFPRLREAPGPLRRLPLPVPEPGFPRGPCARGAGAPRSQTRFLAAPVPGWCGGWDLPCRAQVPRAGPAFWGPWRLRHRIPPRAPEAGTVRRALTARGHGLSRCRSVTCPCAERSRRVRGSAQSPMS